MHHRYIDGAYTYVVRRNILSDCIMTLVRYSSVLVFCGAIMISREQTLNWLFWPKMISVEVLKQKTTDVKLDNGVVIRNMAPKIRNKLM